MKTHSIRTYIIGTLLAGGAAMMSGCSSGWDNTARLHEYMSKSGKTQESLDGLIELTENDNYVKECILRQSAVDSVAYRDMFLTTQAANNSAKLREFNKIAARASLANIEDLEYNLDENFQRTFLNEAKKDGILVAEADELIKEFPKTKNYKTYGQFAADAQQFVDKYFYSKFFTKNKLMGGDIKLKIDSIARSIK